MVRAHAGCRLMPFTAQEIFDKAARGIIKQRYKPSIDKYSRCCYRSKEGLRCAAGHLLTEEELEVVGKRYNTVLFNILFAKELVSGDFGPHLALIRQLQDAHDGPLKTGGPSSWDACMREIAKKHNLSVAELA